MSALKKLKYLTPANLLLITETAAYLVVSRLMILLFPFKWWAHLLGDNGVIAPKDNVDESFREANRITWWVDRIANRSPIKMVCLPKSMTRHLMLRRRGISSTLYLGLKYAETGDLDAHAWVTVDGKTLPSEDTSTYKIVSAFA